ncbi:MAG: hypothetical protein ACRDLQ_10880 [Solirubrobacterales bacterium]
MRGRGASLFCVALGMLPAACGDDGASAPPRASLMRDCRSHVEGKLAPESRREAVRAGPLSLPSARALATAENPNPGARFVDHKTIVVVRAGQEATVVVPPDERRHASLDYGYGVRADRRTPPVKLSDGVPVIRFAACGRGARPLVRGHPLDRETQFNGGIITRWGRCLPLDVWSRGGDRRQRITISFGAGDCDG